MEPRKIRLPDGKIGLFRADATKEEIRALIERDYPTAFTDLGQEDRQEEQKSSMFGEQVQQEEASGFFSNLYETGLKGALKRMGTYPSLYSAQYNATAVRNDREIQDVFAKIDAGQPIDEETKLKYSGQINYYTQASAEDRTKQRQRIENRIQENLKDFQESVKDARAQDAEARAAKEEELAPRVVNPTDIRSLADFRDYLGYILGSAGAQYLPVVGASVVGGLTFGPPGAVAGAVSASTAQALPEQYSQRLEYAIELTKNIPDENERADAVIEYLAKTGSTSALVALGQGALDAFGPTRVISGLFKKKLAGEAGEQILKESEVVEKTALEAMKGVARETPKVMLEEALTGAGQEVIDIAGQFAVGEQTGDVFTGDNIKAVVDSAISESLGSLTAQGINVGVAGVKQKAANRAKANIEEAIKIAEEANNVSEEEAADLAAKLEQYANEAKDNAVAAGKPIDDIEAIQIAGTRLDQERREERARATESKIDTPTPVIEGQTATEDVTTTEEGPSVTELSTEEQDAAYQRIVDHVLATGDTSPSRIQRDLQIGNSADVVAALDQMESFGLVTGLDKQGKRTVLAPKPTETVTETETETETVTEEPVKPIKLKKAKERAWQGNGMGTDAAEWTVADEPSISIIKPSQSDYWKAFQNKKIIAEAPTKKELLEKLQARRDKLVVKPPTVETTQVEAAQVETAPNLTASQDQIDQVDPEKNPTETITKKRRKKGEKPEVDPYEGLNAIERQERILRDKKFNRQLAETATNFRDPDAAGETYTSNVTSQIVKRARDIKSEQDSPDFQGEPLAFDEIVNRAEQEVIAKIKEDPERPESYGYTDADIYETEYTQDTTGEQTAEERSALEALDNEDIDAFVNTVLNGDFTAVYNRTNEEVPASASSFDAAAERIAQARQNLKPRGKQPKQVTTPTGPQLQQPTVNPAFEELDRNNAEIGRDFFPADNVIERIKKTGTPFERLLANRLKPFLERVEVRLADPEKMNDSAGVYIENEDGTRNINLARTGPKAGTNNVTFLHEAIHAATARIIDNHAQDPTKTPLKQQKALNQLEDLRGQVENYIDQRQQNGVATDEELALKDLGAFADTKDFVSYGLSQPEMQNILQKIPAQNTKRGKLSQFIKAVQKLFGFEGDISTAFEDLVLVTDRILDPKVFGTSPPANIVAYANKESKTAARAKNKVMASHTFNSFAEAAKDLFRTRDVASAVKFLGDFKDSISVSSLKAILYTLPSDKIIDLANKFYGLNAPKRIREMVRAVTAERMKRTKTLAEEADLWSKFVRKFGGIANRNLSDSMHLSTLYDIDGTKHNTFEEAVKNDSVIKDAQARAQDPALSVKQQAAAKGEVTKRTEALRIFYKGFKEKQYHYSGWEQLNKDTNGQAKIIYEMAKNRYQKNFQEYYDALIKRIKDNNSISEAAKSNILATIQVEVLDEIAKRGNIYFPLMRFGTHYVGFGKGADRAFYMFESATARNAKARQLAEEYKENTNDPRPLSEIQQEITDIGDSVQLRNELAGLDPKNVDASSKLMKKIFSEIDSNLVVDPATGQKVLSGTSINNLKNEIYQLYIQTLPEQSMRRRFVKRKGTAGFSGDAFRAFLVSNHQATNQLAKMKYSNRVNASIASAYAELEGRGGTNLLKARAYVDRMVSRALAETSGDPIGERYEGLERAIRYGNQAAFFYYLTSAKSAMVQLTQLPLVGLPVLAARYGTIEAVATATKYLNLSNKLATRKVRADGQLTMTFEKPDLKRTKHVLEDIPEDYRGWYNDAIDIAEESGVINETHTTEVSQRTRVPSREYHNTTAFVTRTVANFLSGAFHHMERTSRQLMFSAALDLEMKKQMAGYEAQISKIRNANPNMTRAQAVEALYAPYRSQTQAIQNLMTENKFLADTGRYTEEDAINELLAKDKKIVSPRAAARTAAMNAVDVTYEALFDYGNFNKPELMKGRGITAFVRLPAQFMTFPINMMLFMYKNFFGMIPLLNKTQKREAAIKFFGVMGMSFMFAGTTGLFHYSVMMGLAEAVRDMFRPDEEDEEALWYDMDDDGNPLGKRNLDLWFREWFLPTYFGPDSSIAKAFGLTDEQALTLQRAVKLGPISAITDQNIGSSTSLDGLFYTRSLANEDIDSLWTNVVNAAFGPAGSLVKDFKTAIVEDLANGEYKRGFEKLTPAAIRGFIKASRLAEQGEITNKGVPIRSAEWYHTGKLIGTVAGFSSTEVAEVREKNILAKELEKSILNERSALYDKYDRAIQQYNRSMTDESVENLEEVWKEIGIFNVRNGQYAITGEALYKSATGRAKSRMSAGDGLILSPNSMNAILPLVLKSRVYPEE